MKNNFSFSEEELTHAAGILNQAMLQAVAELEPCTPDFSAEFEAKMSRLGKKYEHRIHTKKIVRSICTVAASFLILVGIWIATDIDARAGLLTWIRETYQNSIFYEFFENSTEQELPLYTLGWIPDGFTETSFYSDENSYSISYTNEKTKKHFIFSYSIIDDQTKSGAFNFSKSEIIDINGNTGEYFYRTESSESDGLSWIDEDKNIMFYLSGNLSKQDIIRISRNVNSE